MNRLTRYIWPGLMLTYVFCILYLIITDTLDILIHPRLNGLIYASVAVLAILSVEEIKRAMKNVGSQKFKWGYLLFLLPILTMFINTDTADSANVAFENGVIMFNLERENTELEIDPMAIEEVTGTASEVASEESSDNTPKDDSNENVGETTLDEEADSKIPFEEALKNTNESGVYFVDDDEFIKFIDSMHRNMNEYIDRQFEYIGIVYKQEDFQHDELVVGRMMMFCCAADAQIAGLLAKSDDAEQYQDGDWVKVIGTFSTKAYKKPMTDTSFDIPYIILDDIQATEAPADPYVYFE